MSRIGKLILLPSTIAVDWHSCSQFSQTMACQSVHKSRRFKLNYLLKKYDGLRRANTTQQSRHIDQTQIVKKKKSIDNVEHVLDGWVFRMELTGCCFVMDKLVSSKSHRTKIAKSSNTNEFQSNSTLFLRAHPNSWRSSRCCESVVFVCMARSSPWISLSNFNASRDAEIDDQNNSRREWCDASWNAPFP